MHRTGLPAAAAILMTAAALADASKPTDKEIFDSACAACHGTDGAGRAPEELAFAARPADFTDCEFASREADADW
ncbi:MAG: cytochrome c, partial [Gammaproteobacteria bacterium]|nr:cytochrome c [Gammaproteobacteria bacterium]